MARIKRLFCSFLAILTCFLTIACSEKKGESEATDSPKEDALQVLLAEGGKSDYVIVADVTNDSDKAFARRLQIRIQELTGATLPIRSASGDRSAQAILIGNTGDAESLALLATMESHDFAWLMCEDGRFLMAATDEAMYQKMEIALEETLFSGVSQTKRLSVTVGFSFLFHRDLNNGVFSKAQIIENGKTEFVLVYGLNGDLSRKAANAASDYIESVSGIQFRVKSDDSQNEKEILLGTPRRDFSDRVGGLLRESGEYGICARENMVAIRGFDRLGVVHAIYRFANLLAENPNQLTLYQCNDILSAHESSPYEVDARACAALYREMFGTFASYVEWKYARLSETDRSDCLLVEALKQRMGQTVALWTGSSTALYEGYYVKLDKDDYSLVTKEKNGHILVASSFFESYFGGEILVENGYVDLTAYCTIHPEYSLYRRGSLTLLIPASVESLEHEESVVNGYTNGAYLDRMERFFNDPERRDPANNTEQSRVEITESPFDASLMYDYTIQAYETNYSPGICITENRGKEVIYVSYETCMVTDYKTEQGNTTYLKCSADGGQSWALLGTVEGMRWACIFEVGEKIYLLGTHVETYHALVGEYNPVTETFRWKDLGITGGIGGANPVLIANGKIYKANGDRVMVADVGDDLLTRESWSFSKQSASSFLTKAWFRSATSAPDFSDYALGEGSILEGRDGKIYMILRIDAGVTCGYAAIVEISEDGSTVSAVTACNSLIQMPTTTSKFSVRYDPVSEMYISLTSLPTMNTDAAKQRNVLAMVASSDLFQWHVVDTLLVDRELMNNTMSAASHAFQYVDFDFSGDSIRFVVREAVGHTNTYHDGKYITMYTVKNFRELIRE